MAAKSEISEIVYARNQPTQKTVLNIRGDPIQKCMLTSVGISNPKIVSKTEELNGWVTTTNGKPTTTEIKNEEGPKARHYIFKRNGEYNHLPFSDGNSESDEESEITPMKRLIQTSSFKERARVDEEYPNVTASGPWKNHSIFDLEKDQSFVNIANAIRLELKDFGLDVESRSIEGRIYYDLNSDAMLEDITFHVNQMLFYQGADGILREGDGIRELEIKLLPGSDLPDKNNQITIKTDPKLSKKIWLNSGTSEVVFMLHFSETILPTFKFFDPSEGVTAVNSYVLSASTRIGGRTTSSDPVFVTVPVGEPKKKYKKLNHGQYYDLITLSGSSKSSDESSARTVDIGITQPEETKDVDISSATVEILRTVNIRPIGYFSKLRVEGPKKMKKGDDVYTKYKADPDDDNLKDVKGQKNYQLTDLEINGYCPTILTDEFKCVYEVQVTTDDGLPVKGEIFVAND